MRPVTGAGLLLASALVVAGADTRLHENGAGDRPEHHLLYLPNGRYLKVASLGQAPLVADAIYLWAIQYYGNFQIEDRYKYVDHIFSDIITELDPHYFDPYWIGALILSVEMEDLPRALALLDKGFANNPDRWIFPYLAGWECAYAMQYERAAEYFRKSASVSGAPADVSRLVAGMYQKRGDASLALTEWVRLARETKDSGIRKIAENRARALEVEIALGSIRSALESYRAAHGVWPRRLDQLVRERFLSALPAPPEGVQYDYDHSAGTVSAGPPRVIPR